MREGPGAGQSVGGADLSLLLFLGVLWGTAFVFITVGLESFSPILLVALRFDITALVMFGIAAVRRKGSLLPRGRVQWTAIAIAAVFNITGYHALLFWAQQHTAAGLAAIIVGMNPVLTTVFSRGLLKDERVGAGGILGLALGIAGIVLIVALNPGGLNLAGISELMIAGAIVAVGGLLALGQGIEFRALAGFALIAAGLVLVTRPDVLGRRRVAPAARPGDDPPH